VVAGGLNSPRRENRGVLVPEKQTPPGQTPPEQTPPGQTPPEQTPPPVKVGNVLHRLPTWPPP